MNEQEEIIMTNSEFLRSIKKVGCYIQYMEYLGEHGHGHYHSGSLAGILWFPLIKLCKEVKLYQVNLIILL